MDGTWLCIDEGDSSSDSFFSDSDKIDSDTEAQLYSVVHHEENLCSLNSCASGMENVQTSEVPALTSVKVNDVFCTEIKRENVKTESINCLMSVRQTDVSNSAEKRKVPSEIFLSKLAQKLNPAKKKKSDSNHKVSNILYSESSVDTNSNQSSKDITLNNKRRRKTDHSSHKDQCSATKNDEVIDSSDSEIWEERDPLTEKDFQTNLCKDENTINLSSDSEFDILSSSKQNVSNLKNLSVPNIKIGGNSKDIWFVNDEDLSKQKKNKPPRRYHDNYEITCANCFRSGHISKRCPELKVKKCFICGQEGHSGVVCKNRICGICYGLGHDTRRCWMPCINYCMLCKMKGHIKENCPDIWRRYHLTTRPGKIKHAKPVKQVKQHKFISCSNCGKAGHFGAVCKESRGFKNFLSTWPCVVSYDDPENLLRKRLNGYSGRQGSFWKDAYLNSRNESYEALNSPRYYPRMKKKKNKANSQNQKACREKDFPRTQKKKASSSPDDDLLESVKLKKEKQLRKREKNRRRKMRQHQKLLFQARIIAGNTEF